MKINQYEFLRDGKPFEPTREEIIQFAEQQLAEKDKEIEELKEHIKFLENKCLNEINVKLVNVTKEKMQEIRKQVYDKIKELLKMHCEYTDEDHIGWYLPEDKIDLLINKVEKGE